MINMNFVKSPIFKKYFIPGVIFQSVVIAGGYGTGREIVEFFLNFGPLGGLLGMVLVTTVLWALVCAATFEFARAFKAYDYRSFFTKLLGKFWFLFEICYFVLLLIVLAVIASAAGSILQETFGLNYYIGVIGMMVGVGILIFKGRDTIESILSYWSFLLYATYIVFVIISFSKFGGNITSKLFGGEILPGWALGGFKYAFYNLGIIPAILFAVRHIETRKEAIGSGIMAGLIGIIPGFLLYLAMISKYPEILKATVPANFMLGEMNLPFFQAIFQIVLFGTLIETGTGFIFAVNERIRSVYEEKKAEMPLWVSVVLPVVLLIAGAFIAQFGLIGLIAKGYGTITWGFFYIYALPVVSLGVWKVIQKDKEIAGQLPNLEVD